MSDYRVRISVRNARLLRAIEKAGHQPGPSFAKVAGVNYQTLLQYLNLTRSPIRTDGLVREDAWDLCDFLNAALSDLWSDEQLTPLEKNSASIDIDAKKMRELIVEAATVDPLKLVEQAQTAHAVQQSLETLTTREAEIISDYYMKGYTLEELAKKHDVHQVRIRQIKDKAERKLSHPSRGLQNFVGPVQKPDEEN